MIALLLHPGDLTLWELAGIFGVFLALTVLPLLIICFVIYRVIKGHSSEANEEKPISLDLNKNL